MKWMLWVLLVTLPLQWFVVVGGLRLHILVMFAFLGASLVLAPLRAAASVLGLTWAFVAANTALSVIWASTNLFHGLGLRPPAQQVLYLGVFVAVATVVHQGLLDPRTAWVDTLRWSALVVSLSLVAALAVSMAVNHVDAATVLSDSVAAADPEILQKELFRAAFSGFGFDEATANGNFRHEVFGSLLVAMTVSAACVGLRPFASVAARSLYVVSMTLAAVLIVISLSRSVAIALVVWPLLLITRAVMVRRVGRGLVAGALLTVAGGAVLARTGLLSVLWVRFTEDTSSYEARDDLLGLAFSNLRANPVTGGVSTASASSHNFVIDSWLRGGVFTGLAAAVVTVLLVGLFVCLVARLGREPAWVLPVTIMFALPLVRLFTAGGGEIPPVSWVGLGIAAGFLAHRRSLLAQARARRSLSAANAGLSTQVDGSVVGHSTSPRPASRLEADWSGSSSSSK